MKAVVKEEEKRFIHNSSLLVSYELFCEKYKIPSGIILVSEVSISNISCANLNGSSTTITKTNV